MADFSDTPEQTEGYLRQAIQYAIGPAFSDDAARIAWLRAWAGGDRLRDEHSAATGAGDEHDDLIERLQPSHGDCPFCGLDPYHYVDNGVGYERVAVVCCDMGIGLFQHHDEQLVKEVQLRGEAADALRAKDAEIERLLTANYRQAQCINVTAQALGPETAATIDALPKAAAHARAEIERLRAAAERFLLAVKRLGEDSGYNRLSFFEAPISKMPNDDLGMEAVSRWRELNDAGVNLRAALKEQDHDALPPAEKEKP